MTADPQPSAGEGADPGGRGRGRGTGVCGGQVLSVGALVGLVAVLLVSCANPRAPSGGPRDTTPPSVVQTRPVRDTVNVSTDTEALRIEFSEYVERSTLSQSLSVTPTFERRPQFNWDGQAVEIQFPSALRDSTTYIFTFGTALSDARGVSLENPITIAFSTGPRINRGQIEGRVVNGRRGTAQQGVDVFAYALPPGAEAVRPLPDVPSYRTQTGEEGRFSFDYMREAPYYVVALRDNNRNRQADPQEPVAVPPRRTLRADSGAAMVPVPWLLAQRDTTAPRLQEVRPVSQQRFRVRFNEPVRLGMRQLADWTVRDSTDGTRVETQGVHSAPNRPNTVVVRTAALSDARYLLPLRRGAVVDTVGRPLVPDTARFRAVPRPDTVRTRFQGFAPTGLGRDSTGARPLLPDVQPGVRFNQAPDSAALREGVAVRDTTGTPQSFALATDNGTTYRLRPDPPLAPGQVVDVTVAGRAFARPDTTYRRRFRRVTDRVLGALAGRARVADTARAMQPGQGQGGVDTTAARQGPLSADSIRSDSVAIPADSVEQEARRARPDSARDDGSVAVELTAVESSVPVAPRQVTTPPGRPFEFTELPEGQYRFRAYLDRNGNGRWDAGHIQPYVPAEPVTWLEEPVEARPRWTTELPAPLRIPVLTPAAVSVAPASDTSGAANRDR